MQALNAKKKFYSKQVYSIKNLVFFFFFMCVGK